MPIVSGGIYRTPEARAAVDALMELAGARGSDHVVVERPGQRLMGCRRSWESTRILVRASPGTKQIIAGTLFPRLRESGTGIAVEDVASCMHDKGRSLVRHFWGAFSILECTSNGVTVALDPLGGTELFYCCIEGGLLLCSELWMLQTLVASPVHVGNLLREITVPNAWRLGADTPFQNIRQVLPGMHTTLGERGALAASCFWEPWPFTRGRRPGVDWEAVLAEQFAHVVACQASAADDIRVSLSGGLDSSCTLLQLASLPARARTSSYTHYHPAYRAEDETQQAQALAAHCGVPWTRCAVDGGGERLAVPLTQSRPAEIRLLQLNIGPGTPSPGAYTWFTGAGGDHLLGHAPNQDLLYGAVREGHPRKFVEYAVLRRQSLPQLVVGFARRSLPWARPRIDERFDSQAVAWLSGRSQLESPGAQQLPESLMYRRAAAAAAGSVRDLYHLIRNNILWTNHEEHHSVSPYVALPFVEAALCAPRHRLFDACNDKLLFRQAMSRRFQVNLFNTPKGMYSRGICDEMIANAEQVHADYIAGSRLRAAGWVEPEALERAFDCMIQHGDAQADLSLRALIAVERWLDGWKTVVPALPMAF